ncbi:MAG: hypothetical protein CMP10_20405 [Zetaproteobacteria bacterium]|nr:hypothetical protein [Pseudobdellovibrionaceae bacterium]|tara:strand:- start:819 stop:1010 length:192 start_codon:yes stop_codon:yes gene_type:complete
MRVGKIFSMPNEYTRFARIRDKDGSTFTVDPSLLPEGSSKDKNVAYKVEIWGSGGLVNYVEED